MASPAPTAADTAALEHGIAAFDSAMNAGDVDALAALYTADAVSIPPDAPPAEGSDAIRKLWTDFLAQGSPVHQTGNFAVVWRKQADGSWMAVMNIWNRGAPAPSM